MHLYHTKRVRVRDRETFPSRFKTRYEVLANNWNRHLMVRSCWDHWGIDIYDNGCDNRLSKFTISRSLKHHHYIVTSTQYQWLKQSLGFIGTVKSQYPPHRSIPIQYRLAQQLRGKVEEVDCEWYDSIWNPSPIYYQRFDKIFSTACSVVLCSTSVAHRQQLNLRPWQCIFSVVIIWSHCHLVHLKLCNFLHPKTKWREKTKIILNYQYIIIQIFADEVIDRGVPNKYLWGFYITKICILSQPSQDIIIILSSSEFNYHIMR